MPRLLLLLLILLPAIVHAQPADRPRVREAGIRVGVLSPGPFNAITDVDGVRIGHVTIQDSLLKTGVTAIIPHQGNLFQEKVPAGVEIGNGFGKLAGTTQVRELGEIEAPIILTNTLSVAEGIAGAVEWTLEQRGNEAVRSVNTVVGETNDGYLNDIRSRAVTIDHVRQAIEQARAGEVEEGNVGAGTGTIAFGWKGGIGTSSRRLPQSLGGFTVGVLVQANYGGQLTIDGVRVGEKLGQYYLQRELDAASADGSVMIVIATDAPISDRNLERMARRAFLGIGRTGSPMTNGSGDYAIAFATSESVRRTPERRGAIATIEEWPNDRMSPLFQAVVEATEEAVYNALFAAETVSGQGRTVEALPIEAVLELMRNAGRLHVE